MPIVDIHAHIIVKEITKAADSSQAWRPSVDWIEGKQLVEFGGKTINSALREFVDVEQILIEQERAGVEVTLLSPWSSLFRYGAKLDVAIQANQIQNDAISKLVKRFQPRLAGVGTVPMQDADASVAELKRIVNELGLSGVEIGSNVNGNYLGHPDFRPFWEAAEALDAFVLIHPVSGLGGPTNREYYLWNAFANPAETALSTAHIILSGLLEEHPGLKICPVHGGGHLPYQIGRLDRAYEMRPEAQQCINRPPSFYLKQMYFDTITHSREALAYLVDLVGPDRVLMGSDYPFDMGYERPAELVRSLGLSKDEEYQILGGNAGQLLNLEV